MKPYQSKSIALRYDSKQDRLQWLGDCGDDQFASIWISRRILIRLLDNLSQWLDKQTEQQQASTGNIKTAHQDSVNQFAHEAAQREVVGVSGEAPNAQVIRIDFLLDMVRLTPIDQHSIKLLLFDEKSHYEIFSVMTLNELHKILAELLRLSDLAGWKIAHPWQTTSRHKTQDKVMH